MTLLLDAIIDEALAGQLVSFSPAFLDPASAYGSVATQQKVRWYQTILKIVVADPTVSINGDHNDPATRHSLRNLQKYYQLKPTSYLTVATNTALTQLALEWIYRVKVSDTFGKKGAMLTGWIQRFQHDYGLTPDGKVGPNTRTMMMDVLLAKRPTPIRNFHSQFGPLKQAKETITSSARIRLSTTSSLTENTAILDTNLSSQSCKAPRKAIHGSQDDRRPVRSPAAVPRQWICRIRVDGMWAGTGVLVSPRHVLTAGHVVYHDSNDKDGFRSRRLAKKLEVSPAFDGHVLRKNRQFNKKAPFGVWSVDMQRIFLPSCYVYGQDLSARPPTNSDCDIAVLTLKAPIGLKKFTAQKTVFEQGRRKHIFHDFDPLGYWGIDPHHQIVAYQPQELDNFKVYSSGYPGSSKGIMQRVSGKIDNSLIAGRFLKRQYLPSYKYSSNLFENRFAHLVDMSEGQSGSPVWRTTTASKPTRKMIGVLTDFRYRCIEGKADVFLSEGVALTLGLLREIAAWAPEMFTLEGKRLLVKE